MVESSLDAAVTSADKTCALCSHWGIAAAVGVVAAAAVAGYFVYRKMHEPKIITYREVVQYFMENKNNPEFAGFKKAAAMREPGKVEGEYKLSLVFLGEDDKVLGGKIHNRALLDEDLKEMFGENDLIIF